MRNMGGIGMWVAVSFAAGCVESPTSEQSMQSVTAGSVPEVQTFEAEQFADMEGIYTTPGLNPPSQPTDRITYVDDGDWVRYSGVKFGEGHGIARIRARLATPYGGGTVTFRLDSLDGPVLGTINTTATGDWYRDFVTEATGTTASTTGPHDVYVTFSGPGNGLGQGIGDFDWFKFERLTKPLSISYGYRDDDGDGVVGADERDNVSLYVHAWNIASGSIDTSVTKYFIVIAGTTHVVAADSQTKGSFYGPIPDGAVRVLVRSGDGAGHVSLPWCIERQSTSHPFLPCVD